MCTTLEPVHLPRASLTPAAAALCGLLLAAGCPGGMGGSDAAAGSDAAVAQDLSAADRPRPPDRGPGAEGGPAEGGPADVSLPDSVMGSCQSCGKDQICAHFVDPTTCKVTKLQCRSRSVNCVSAATNPCVQCEVEVCGYYYTGTSSKCSMPTDGGAFPSLYCYCFHK